MQQRSALTPESQRAARALLGWGVRDLAAASGVAWTTVSKFENGGNLRPETVRKIETAFEVAGVQLVRARGRLGATIAESRSI